MVVSADNRMPPSLKSDFIFAPDILKPVSCCPTISSFLAQSEARRKREIHSRQINHVVLNRLIEAIEIGD